MNETIKTTRKIASAEILDRLFKEFLMSIRRVVPVLREDESGAMVPAYNQLGEAVTEFEYFQIPTLFKFLNYIGIDRSTWTKYRNPNINPDFEDVTKRINTFFESYLDESALLGTANPHYVTFNLSNNFGWKDKKEVELGKKTREAVQLNTLSPKEKMEKLKALKNLTLPGDSE